MIKDAYTEIDGIKVFHQDITEDNEDYNAEGLDGHYAVEKEHFWFVSRREFIVECFKRNIPQSAKIIEIGAGTGNVARELIASGYSDFSVGEMHMNGLRYAKSYGIEDCYQFDLLRTPFEKEFDVVCMFDVLEHIEDESLALCRVNESLKSGGMLMLTLPAHMWLWSAVDDASFHKRRYTKKHLKKVLYDAGFELVEMRYFFKFLVPMLLVRSLLNAGKRGEDINSVNTGSYISSLPNKILLALMRFENSLGRLVPDLFGGSLYAAARKKD